jgi:hypothetical protein
VLHQVLVEVINQWAEVMVMAVAAVSLVEVVAFMVMVVMGMILGVMTLMVQVF